MQAATSFHSWSSLSALSTLNSVILCFVSCTHLIINVCRSHPIQFILIQFNLLDCYFLFFFIRAKLCDRTFNFQFAWMCVCLWISLFTSFSSLFDCCPYFLCLCLCPPIFHSSSISFFQLACIHNAKWEQKTTTLLIQRTERTANWNGLAQCNVALSVKRVMFKHKIYVEHVNWIFMNLDRYKRNAHVLLAYYLCKSF